MKTKVIIRERLDGWTELFIEKRPGGTFVLKGDYHPDDAICVLGVGPLKDIYRMFRSRIREWHHDLQSRVEAAEIEAGWDANP